jgi:hypothetical protein
MARARAGDHHELVAGLQVVGAVGEEATGVGFSGGVGVFNHEDLARAIAAAAPKSEGPVADSIWIDDQANAKMGAGTTKYTILGFRGPQAGRYWEITNVVILGSDDMTAVANTTAIFCVGDPTNPVLTDVRVPGSNCTIPMSIQLGPHTVNCPAGRKPYVKVYGAGTTQPVMAILNGWDRPMWADHDRSLPGPLGAQPDTMLDREHPDRYADPHRAEMTPGPQDQPTFDTRPPGWSRRTGGWDRLGQ